MVAGHPECMILVGFGSRATQVRSREVFPAGRSVWGRQGAQHRGQVRLVFEPQYNFFPRV